MSRPSAAAARFAGRPLALARARLPGVLAFHPDEACRPGDRPAPYVVTEGGVAVVPVLGPLVARGDWLSDLFGAVAYGEFVAAIAAAMDDPAVGAVLMEIDSPGGEVAGLFDTVDMLRALKEGSGKPLHAVASEAALSAAYAIASAADRLVVTRTAEVGSVGVLAVHVDESGADREAGLAWSYVFAGERKLDGNAHAPLSDRARSDMQADVDRLHADFCALVAANRGMSAGAVRATEAAVFRGALAVEAGLADAVGTLDTALTDLSAALERPVLPSPAAPLRRSTLAMADDKRRQEDRTVETGPGQTDPVPAGPAPQLPTPALPAGAPAPPPLPPAHDPAERYRAEFADIADVAAQGARLGVAIDAADAVRRGVSADALRRSVLDTLAERSAAADVIAAAPRETGRPAAESPIVKRARDRAAATRT